MSISFEKSPVYRTVLDNGIVLLVHENPTADIIAGRIFVRAGNCYEPTDKSGLGHLLSAVITKGCAGMSSLEIAETVESIGASLSADIAADYFLLSLKTVTADFAEIFSLAGKILRSPTFPEAEVELERRLALQDIRSQSEQPFSVAFDKLRQAMYQNHPYGLSGLGTEETVRSITREDLLNFHSCYFRPDNMVISIAGNITPVAAIDQVERVFGSWRVIGNIPTSKLILPEIRSQPCYLATAQHTQQSIIMLGYFAPAVNEPDYAALKLLSTYLGNGLSSRLFVELREKRGLAYDVSAFFPTRLFTSSFVVYMGTAPENTVTALQGLRHEVDLLSQIPLTETALEAAKNKIIGQYALGKQTNAQIAQIYGWYEILDLGVSFDSQFQTMIQSVTPEDAIAAANRYLREPYISILGQGDAIAGVNG
ncbi:M16 family metallopeptidase [Calothrix sp. NIES-3974]|uniref:M16 family metallopeptidase n=1 Tax=Calothrix sp. NIES-3974 TaxID=2005462 RepID=UPI000B601730|nr:pitrilysin family protein [Calothrix sp. NIES-3974]BAZ08112.1 processing protease [Calothrix sp. NIES-3974]